MEQMRRFLGFSAGDRHLVLLAFMVLSAIRLGLRFLPFRTLLYLLTCLAPLTPALLEPNAATLQKRVWAVEYVSRRMAQKPKCLARALTVQVLLRWQGYCTQLCIGVAKNPQGHLGAHAWVESNGEVIIGDTPTLSQFTLLPSLEKGLA